MTWIYNIFGTMLSWFNQITGSYALALILYALVFKIVFLPFAIKQQKNQIKMARLTPKIEVIKAKYKGRTDKATQQKMQQEIMELQQKEGYSAMSGCLPLLLQMPIIIFLYNVIRGPLSYICKFWSGDILRLRAIVGAAESVDEIGLVSLVKNYIANNGTSAFTESINMANVPSLGMYSIGTVEHTIDVSSIPSFDLFGINLAETPSFTNISWLVVIPFIAAALQWLTMWITRKLNNTGVVSQGDIQTQTSMKMMDLVMPVMTLFIAFNFYGMLGLYWIYQSILAILQTLIISKLMPMPKYTEEELKAMKKAQKEAERAQKAALKSQPKYKSLHYIDDDDYEELPTMQQNKARPQTRLDGIDKPEIKD